MLVSGPTAMIGRKLQSLDGLRAIAIILVFFNHLKGFFPVVNAPTFYFQWYVGQGWIGVDLFFVLSGFLITGILLDIRNAENYFSGFYARRVLRIFPLYYTVLIGVIVASQILTKIHVQQAPIIASLVPLPEDRWVYFCYLTNWIGLWKAQWDAQFGSILAHFWSLAVEEQFYFVWPAIVWVVRPRAIPWIAGIVAGLSAVIRLGWVAHCGIQMVMPQSAEIQLATICRLDGLFIGALCACLFRNPELMPRIRKWLPWIASLGLCSFFLAFSALLFFPVRAAQLIYGPAPAILHSLDDATRLFALCGGFTLLALGFGALVLLAACTESESSWMQKLLKSRFLAPIGAYSYGIYVFHVPILGLASTFLLPRIVVRSAGEAAITECAYIVVLAAASFIISAISYEFFEKRILSFKRYFVPKYAPVPYDASVEVAVAD
jgi:peptidoglycan/LPS O-acetylase OafA/YrhL